MNRQTIRRLECQQARHTEPFGALPRFELGGDGDVEKIKCKLKLTPCANINAHQSPPASLGDTDRVLCAFNFQTMFRGFFIFSGALLLMAKGASVRHWYWADFK